MEKGVQTNLRPYTRECGTVRVHISAVLSVATSPTSLSPRYGLTIQSQRIDGATVHELDETHLTVNRRPVAIQCAPAWRAPTGQTNSGRPVAVCNRAYLS